MKVIGFSASGHKDGNTAWSVGKILQGAREQGAKTVFFSASELSITPCRGCFACKSSDDGCVIKDDMQRVYDALRDADALVFASPIYIGQMTGQAKLFLDRLFPITSPKFSPFYQERPKSKLLFVVTQGNPDRAKFQEYIDYTNRMFALLEYEIRESVVIAGTRAAQAKEMENLEEQLLRAGAQLCK